MINQAKLGEEIGKLNDKEVLEQIMETNKEQLSNIGIMAYIELFNRNLYLKAILNENRTLIDELLAEDSKFKDVYEDVESKALNLNNILDLDNTDKSLDLENLKKQRKDIVKILRTLSAYSTEISYTYDIAKEVLYKQFISESEIELDKQVDNQKFFDAVSKFVMEDPTTLKNRIMDLTNVLPMRIAKSKYYDIIGDAFRRNLNYSSKRQADVVLARYKTLLNGSLEAEYGLYFNRYFIKAQEARQVDFNKSSKEELNKIYEDAYNAIMEIGVISNVIRELGVILNRMIAIATLKENIVDDIKKYDLKSLKDSWIIHSEDESEENQKKVLKNYKALFKTLDTNFKTTNAKLQVLTMENFNRKNKIQDELKMELTKTQYILEYINDYAVDQEEILESDYQSIVEKDYLAEAVDNLIKFIERNITQMDGLQRRMRMKRLLALTENAFKDPNVFFEYVANSIERTSSKEELIATTNGVIEIITEYRSGSSFRN